MRQLTGSASLKALACRLFQGGVLSPNLFNLFLADIVDYLNIDKGVYIGGRKIPYLFGAKPAITWTNAELWSFVPLGRTSDEVWIKYEISCLWKCTWKCGLRNGGDFVTRCATCKQSHNIWLLRDLLLMVLERHCAWYVSRILLYHCLFISKESNLGQASWI